MAVEVATTIPRPCRIGVVVSPRVGHLHHLDLAAVEDVLTAVVPRTT